MDISFVFEESLHLLVNLNDELNGFSITECEGISFT